ncbi:hypothetical protein AYK21_02905 [Thermoplasmatales archaeon SG8-52-2]|nr:MAG: hypothetical protein AYK21_02905 [Thermoplasmatales archaeon SG8-52-2]
MLDSKSFKIYLVIGIIFLFLGLSISPSASFISIKKSSTPMFNGNTLYVGGSGPDNYTNIIDAIEDALNGDIVFVYNGVYYENILIDKSIYLIGEDRDNTIIDGSQIGNVIYISADWVNVSGFTLQNSSEGWDKGGIMIYSSHTTIFGNIVMNNYNGICIISSSNNNITGNYVIYNKMAGIDVRYSSYNNIIIDNTVQNNDDGIYLYDSSDNNLIDNTVSNNYNNGILIYSSSDNLISDNIVTNNYYGLCLKSSSSNNNIISDNTVSDNQRTGIYLDGSDNNFISNNTISYNQRTGIGIYAHSNNIRTNTISNNYDNGIYLWGSSDNNIIGNTISNNSYGICLAGYSTNNNIYHNNFLENMIFDAYGQYEIFENTWDDDKYGNYWSDYEERYPVP